MKGLAALLHPRTPKAGILGTPGKPSPFKTLHGFEFLRSLLGRYRGFLLPAESGGG